MNILTVILIDINMGCPVQKVLKAHAGKLSIAVSRLVYDIVKNVCKSSQ